MEEDYEPSVQSQRRVNPKIHDVIKKEVEKLLDAGLIYPISDSPWVSPSHAFWAYAMLRGTFQRCMWQSSHDMIERKTMEVFMDDFSVFGDSFSTCLTHLEKMLKRCEDTNLSLNWEKSHFMNLTLNIRDNKGAEESRAVICPVLDNPLNDKLEENKEINEAFPLETLGSIALQDQSDRRCVSGQEALEFSSLAQLDLLGDTYGANYKQKNFRLGFYWGPNHLQGPPDFVTVVHLSTSRKNTARDEMPQKLHSCEKSLTSGAFDFMGQFRLQRNKAYENFLILIKRKTRGIHDAKIKKPRVNVGDRVILFNYRTEDFLGQIEITYSRIVKALDSVIFNSSFTSSASFWEFRKRYLTKDRKTQLQKMTKPDTEWKSCEGQSQSKAK
ncbi:reverse transcriptase domain-containing protein [Tanacetum coccineum]|uniref:Reverse transcriptase domain-containing protein n=1 Tax=Tanacetum coccineum TaxID=301880 RepID=A0ABQ5CE82_9ASTR